MSTETKLPGRSKSAARLKLAREWHLYLGTLFAPSILFFAMTGAMQLFGLHKGRPGAAHQPAVWIQKLASIHMDQNTAQKPGPPPGFGGIPNESLRSSVGERKGPPPPDQADRPPRSFEGPPGRGRPGGPLIPTFLLKFFFLGTALGLISSTLLGIYMAFKFNRSRALVWGLLFLGTAIPLALVAMMA